MLMDSKILDEITNSIKTKLGDDIKKVELFK